MRPTAGCESNAASSFDQFIIDQSPNDLNYGLLKTVQSSRFSSLMPWHLDQVSNIISQETINTPINTIIDACANIGVDTILFRLLFPYANIVAIELNTDTYNVLKENMDNISQITGQYKKPITVKNMDCLDYINNVDLLYFDPPWPDNYKQGTINLSLSGYDLGDIVNNAIKNATLVIVKLPFNFNFNLFEQKVNRGIKTIINYYKIFTQGKNPKIAYELAFIRKL